MNRVLMAAALGLALISTFGMGEELTSAALEQVKERTVDLLHGGTSTGPRRMAVTERSDTWCGAWLDTGFSPVERIEGDPIGTTRRARDRSGEVRRLAFAFSDPNGEWYRNSRVLDEVSRAVDDLLELYDSTAARDGNWHTWLIAVPDNLLAVGLLMEDALDTALLDRLIAIMAGRLERMVLTGANASWEARNHIYLALLTDDETRLAEAAHRVSVDVRYGSVSGVREDYAYLFHGQIPYAGVYGAGFAQTVGQFIYLFSGTPWAIPEQKADLVANLLLEHSRWFVVGDRIDRTVVGRGYEKQRRARPILEAMLYLAQSDTDRSAEMARAARALIEGGAAFDEAVASWADDLMASTVRADGSVGFRFWPSAEVGAFWGDGFQVGFRQYSRRVQDYEYLILQGGEGWNLALGAIDLMRLDGSGDWYDGEGLRDGIDMEFLPGVTARAGVNPTNPTDRFSGNTGFSLNYGTEAFSGGCGWLGGGAAGFVLTPPYGGFTARKSLHFFANGYWAIGSGISVTEPPSADAGTVRTILVQWPTNEAHPMLTVSGGRLIEVGEVDQPIEDVDWFWLDGIGVVSADPTTVHCSRVNDVVTVWLDHGVAPVDAGYAYAVLPVTTDAVTRQFSEAPSIRPLATGSAVHGVGESGDGDRSLVFFEPGTCGDVSTDRPVIVHLTSNDTGDVLTVQNPLHTEEIVHVEVDLEGEVTFASPEVAVEDGSPRGIEIETQLGRIYRLATGEVGQTLAPIRREDLADLHRFKVTARSDSDETLLTVRLPRSWRADTYRISIHGRLGHHLTYLGADDVIEALPDDTLVYRWDRSLPDGGEKVNKNLFQRSGDFRIWYETEDAVGIDYFSIPLFDPEGSEIPDPDFRPDMNSPYR